MENDLLEDKNDSCQITRWQLIKSTLNNLDYPTFVQRSKDDPDAVLLDVRTNQEHASESIPGSLLVDYLDRNLADNIEKLDHSKSYYVYCRTGRRSLRVCVILKNLGFEKVYNLEGGIVSASSPQT